VKTNVAILGTGNIGCDLLAKIERNPYLHCSLFVGRNLKSDGMRFAADRGITCSDESIKAIEETPGIADIVFDATTAAFHHTHAPILQKLGKYTIDLTPSKIGKMCVPILNKWECLSVPNINLITCGGQATIPMIKAIKDVCPKIEYVEIVASISSKSAGPGTRQNIDEFTQTTKNAIASLCGIEKTKAIIVLNPADPPIMMHNTIYIKVDNPHMEMIQGAVSGTEALMQQIVPGYRVTCGPLYENGRLIIMIEVIGLGDYLPIYSGNLDIITCAAVNMAEAKAKEMQGVDLPWIAY
jgi:acetaldehyde dehydrogenase (acetylating)